MKLRISLSLLASIAALSCGPSSNSRIADCTGVCAGGTTCDFGSGKCVASSASNTGGGNGATGLPCDVAGVLAAKCISCHGATPSGGAPNSLTTRENLTAQSNLGGTVASRCLARVQDPQVPMPPRSSGVSISAADLAVLQGWVNAGLPGGACSSASQPAGGGTGGGTGGGLATGSGGGANGGGGGSTQCTTDTWANYGQTFFANQCASCHQGQFATKSLVVTNTSIITSRISSGSMPPNGLTATDRARILKYLSCGVP